MNLDNTTTIDVKLSVNSTWRLHKHRSRTDPHHKTKHAHSVPKHSKMSGMTIRKREEYHLTPKNGNLHSKVMLLNGKELTVNSSGDIPSLQPLFVNSTEPITVAPYSIVFAHIPHFTLYACNN